MGGSVWKKKKDFKRKEKGDDKGKGREGKAMQTSLSSESVAATWPACPAYANTSTFSTMWVAKRARVMATVRDMAWWEKRAEHCHGGQWWSECHDLPGEASLEGHPKGASTAAE